MFAVRAHVLRVGERGVKIETAVQGHAERMVSWLPTLNAENHLVSGPYMPQ